jgi:hypothetical protein
MSVIKIKEMRGIVCSDPNAKVTFETKGNTEHRLCTGQLAKEPANSVG